jgi:hypothetical protein
MGSIANSADAIASVSTTSETVIFRATWTGLNGAGAISIPGLQVGDRILQLVDSSPSIAGNPVNTVQLVVTVADQLHQNANGNLTSITYEAVFVRGLSGSFGI